MKPLTTFATDGRMIDHTRPISPCDSAEREAWIVTNQWQKYLKVVWYCSMHGVACNEGRDSLLALLTYLAAIYEVLGRDEEALL
jgi:hypothetical protein